MTKTKVGGIKLTRSSSNLSAPHYTTTDLFKIQPVFCREVSDGDKFNIEMKQINRVDALPYPSFVEIENRHDWYYVKFNQVWKPYDSFRTGAPYAFNYLNTVPSKVPYLTLDELFAFFVGNFTLDGNTYSLVSIVDDIDNPSAITDFTTAQQDYKDHKFDFVYIGPKKTFDSSAPLTDYCLKTFVLNPVGRYIYSIFYALGYRIPRYYVDQTQVTSTTVKGYMDQAGFVENYYDLHSLELSFLPIMAYMSVVLNYYVPTKFRDYTFVNSLSYLAAPLIHKTGISLMVLDSDLATFRGNVINLLLSLFYGSDYFTDSLVTPFAAASTLINMSDPQSYLQSTGSTNYTPPAVSRGSNNPTYYGQAPIIVNSKAVNSGSQEEHNNHSASQYLLSVLKAVSTKSQIAALTKNNILSSMMQQFGVKPESADMIPYHLKAMRDNIVIEPEISTAATSLAPLGYKAGTGKGVAQGKMHFEFDNYGMLICINAIAPDVDYVDGINREMLHIIKEDYLDPAYAQLGYQAVGNCELTINPEVYDRNTNDFDITKTFGFQKKYAEYDYPKAGAGGDFVINSVNNTLDAFHFIRKLDGSFPDALRNALIFHMAKYPRTWLDNTNLLTFLSQYDRIFDVQSPDFDHIQQWTYFKVLAKRNTTGKGDFTIGDDYDNKVEGTPIMDNQNV